MNILYQFYQILVKFTRKHTAFILRDCLGVGMIFMLVVVISCKLQDTSSKDQGDVFYLFKYSVLEIFQGLEQLSFKNECSKQTVSLFYSMDYPVPLEKEIGLVTQDGKIELNKLGKLIKQRKENFDSMEGYHMFWVCRPDSETMGIPAQQIYEWQQSAFPVLEIAECQKCQILITSNGDRVDDGSLIVFWREEKGVLYFFSGVTDTNGINAYLMKDKTYQSCIFQKKSDDEFFIAFSEMIPSKSTTIDFCDGFKYRPTRQNKTITGIFPFKKGIYPFRGIDPLSIHLYFTQTPLKFDPMILCVFYEGNTEFDLVGKSGVMFIAPDKIKAKMKKGIPQKNGSHFFLEEVNFKS